MPGFYRRWRFRRDMRRAAIIEIDTGPGDWRVSEMWLRPPWYQRWALALCDTVSGWIIGRGLIHRPQRPPVVIDR